MKKFKLLFIAFLGIIGLTGCRSTQDNPYTPFTPKDTPVERIEALNPIIKIDMDNVAVLKYAIYPSSATNKSVKVDTSNLNYVADIYIDSSKNIIVYGIYPGTGLISLVTNNGKVASYSITVNNSIPPEPEPDIPTDTPDAEAINNYFKFNSGLNTEYVTSDDYKGYLLKKFIEYSTDDTLDKLRAAADTIKCYLPNYLFKYTELYRELEVPGEHQYSIVMVNSNISSAASLYSYIENEKLYIELLIYDYNVNGGLYT